MIHFMQKLIDRIASGAVVQANARDAIERSGADVIAPIECARALSQIETNDHFFDVTPNDGTDLKRPARALVIGTGGDVSVVNSDGVSVVFKNQQDGAVLPIATRRVNSTGTDASDIVAL